MNDDLNVWKKFAQVGLLGLTPLVLIFIFFKISPENSLFYEFIELTKNISTNISSKNLELTKPLGMYCKLAPLFSLYFAVIYLKHVKSTPKVDNKASLVFYSIGFVATYAILFYIFLISSFDINSGSRLLKATTSNDYFTLFYYFVVFTGLYTLTFTLIILFKLLYTELHNRILIK